MVELLFVQKVVYLKFAVIQLVSVTPHFVRHRLFVQHWRFLLGKGWYWFFYLKGEQPHDSCVGLNVLCNGLDKCLLFSELKSTPYLLVSTQQS